MFDPSELQKGVYQPPAPGPDTKYQADPMRDGVKVPALQAAITGMLTGMFVGGLIIVLRALLESLHVQIQWNWLRILLGLWWFPLALGFLAGSASMLHSWVSYRLNWQAIFETITGVDWNGDGKIGVVVEEKPKEPETVRIEVIEDNGRRGEFIDLPFPERLPELASGIVDGKRQFSQTTWSGRGHLFSRSEFETLRGELIRRGLARWKNPDAPAQGVELTPAGKAVLRRLAEKIK